MDKSTTDNQPKMAPQPQEETPAPPHKEMQAPPTEPETDSPAPPPAPPQGRKSPIALIGAILLVAALIAIGAYPRMVKNSKLAAAAQEVRHSVTEVNIVSPHLMGSGVVTLPSNVQAIEEATINARTSGYLKARYVDIGSRVKAGQTLAVIESPEADQEVMQAEADQEKAVAGSGQATAEVARLQADVAQARSGLAESKSNLAQTRADLEHIQAKQAQAQAFASVAQARLAQARQNLAGRQADLNHANARFELARKTLKRWKELEKVDAVSGQEVDEKQADYDVGQANVASAKAAISSAQADVDAAQAGYVSSQADVRAAQADVVSGRQKVSAEQSAVESSQSNVAASQASVVAGRENVNAAQAAVRSSEAGARRYTALRSFERIVAPFSGVITARNLDVGALINAGNASSDHDPNRTVSYSGIFGIARTDTLRILVQVPESSMSGIKPGQKARVLIQELPGRIFTGTIYRTAGALDDASRTLLTEIHLSNTDNTLMPGMYAQVEFVNSKSRPTLRIPANALIFDARGTRVAIVTPDNKIHFQSVLTGRDYGSEVEIRTGLKGDEKLVSNPTDDLTEGLPVHVVKTPN